MERFLRKRKSKNRMVRYKKIDPTSLVGAPNTLQRDKEEGPNSVQRIMNSDQAFRNRTKIVRILLLNCTNSDQVKKEFGVSFARNLKGVQKWGSTSTSVILYKLNNSIENSNRIMLERNNSVQKTK